jgi:hypothetical protein
MHRHVANKNVNDRVSSNTVCFSHKGLRTFRQVFRGRVSKQTALPASSRAISSYYSLQMMYLCRTTHKTWFHAVTAAGFYTCVPQRESWGYCTFDKTERRQTRLSLHFQCAASFVKWLHYIYFSHASPGHILTDFHQMGEVYTTKNSVSQKRSWYITDIIFWCYNGHRVFPRGKADEAWRWTPTSIWRQG